MPAIWWLIVLLLPAYLDSQTHKPYVLDLSTVFPTLDSLSFNVTDVIDATGVTDGHFGSVYTGPFNSARDLVFEGSMALSLKTSLLRAVTQMDRPKATLLIHYLRIDEEVGMKTDRRRLHLIASLTLPTTQKEETSRHYGPREVLAVRGGLFDKTSGHAPALMEGLTDLLRLLDQDVRAGLITTQVHSTESTVKPDLPDGAYYSVVDFRTGRVDTSLHLALKEMEIVGTVGELPYRRADFLRPAARSSRENYRELWGYRHDGRDYRYLQQTFYELQSDTAGNVLTVIPDLLDVEETTKRVVVGQMMFGLMGALLTKPATKQDSTEVYRLDLTNGTLHPVAITPNLATVGGRIILHHTSEVPDYILTIEVKGATYTLPANTYITMDEPGRIVLTAGHGKAKPYYRDIALGANNQPTLYRIVIDEKGRIDFDHRKQTEALAVASAVTDGTIRHAGE